MEGMVRRGDRRVIQSGSPDAQLDHSNFDHEHPAMMLIHTAQMREGIDDPDHPHAVRFAP
jgi:hypothetical protein